MTMRNGLSKKDQAIKNVRGEMDSEEFVTSPKVVQTPSRYQADILNFMDTGRGHGLVKATAGSGKTTLLMMVAAQMAAKYGDEKILFCAYSREIRNEIAARVEAAGLRINVKTMHGIGFGMIRKHLKHLDIKEPDNSKYYEIIKPMADELYEQIVEDFKALDQTDGCPEASDVHSWIQDTVELIHSTLCNFESADAVRRMADFYAVNIMDQYFQAVHACVVQAINEGARQAGEEGKISFSDMLYLPARWNLTAWQYRIVLGDECQDWSTAQLELAMKSCAMKYAGRMLCVGDPDQSIFGFAGADPESFWNIQKALKCKIFPLSICYRCPTKAIEMAKQIVPDMEARPNAPEGVVEWLENLDPMMAMVRDGDMVLCRKTAPLIEACIAMLARGITARIRGTDIGAQLNQLVDKIAKRKGFAMSEFKSAVSDYIKRQFAKIEKSKKSVDERKKSLEDRVLSIMAIFDSGEFNTVAALKTRIESIFSDDRIGVVLCTGHRSKGLENDRIFILEADKMQLRWPGQRQWQAFQEQCLEFVMLTRCKKEMYLIKANGKKLKTDGE